MSTTQQDTCSAFVLRFFVFFFYFVFPFVLFLFVFAINFYFLLISRFPRTFSQICWFYASLVFLSFSFAFSYDFYKGRIPQNTIQIRQNRSLVEFLCTLCDE